MSGICGLWLPSGEPVAAGVLERMAAPLEVRAPEGTGVWRQGEVGLGHTLLATTPELVFERQPWRHGETGCAIVADVRLDNRDDLIRALGLAQRYRAIGDAELIVHAWLAWGEACPERLLGDFAFALFDPRQRTLLLARDHTGMRPLYYHHQPGQQVVFASEARAVLASGRVAKRINEGRIADFLVTQLEGDKVSTFFEGIYRLAPANRLVVTPDSARLERYWRPEAQDVLKLADDGEYAEALREVFTEAVRCRLRSPEPVGSMLSGGMDSGSVVAVARELLAAAGEPPLKTFSAVGPDPQSCVETRAIGHAAAMDGLDPQFVNHAHLEALMPELEELTWNLQEPFDGHMTLLRAVWLAAHRQDLKVMLHGAGGDGVFTAGTYIARLLCSGRWLRAAAEARGEARFYQGQIWGSATLYRAGRHAFVPAPLRHWRQAWRERWPQRRAAADVRACLIAADFARRIELGRRLLQLDSHSHDGVAVPYPVERAQAMAHPYTHVGHERYDRVASAMGMELRDPFMDRRLIEFCLSLPAEQRLAAGWPKIVLRRAMAGRLPEAVRWRRGKEHLGWAFTRALVDRMRTPPAAVLREQAHAIGAYVDPNKLAQALAGHDDEAAARRYETAHLAAWLARQTH